MTDVDLPTTMVAAVYSARGEITVEERPVPRPGPGQVLVEVGHCGICGSDIHIILEGWGKPGVVEGHEWSGVVAAVGDGVDGAGRSATASSEDRRRGAVAASAASRASRRSARTASAR